MRGALEWRGRRSGKTLTQAGEGFRGGFRLADALGESELSGEGVEIATEEAVIDEKLEGDAGVGFMDGAAEEFQGGGRAGGGDLNLDFLHSGRSGVDIEKEGAEFFEEMKVFSDRPGGFVFHGQEGAIGSGAKLNFFAAVAKIGNEFLQKSDHLRGLQKFEAVVDDFRERGAQLTANMFCCDVHQALMAGRRDSGRRGRSTRL